MFYIAFDDLTLCGSSPEPLVTVQGDRVETRPIAGTRPRGASPAEDRRLSEDLLADEKERAEHVMLVDLGRNDLGRVCARARSRSTSSWRSSYYSHVMHIVSSVTGTLARGRRRVRRARGDVPRRHGERRPQGARHGDHRRARDRARAARTPAPSATSASVGDLDTCIYIRTVLVKDGVALRAGRRRHRRRLRAREGVRGDAEQGRGACCAPSTWPHEQFGDRGTS